MSQVERGHDLSMRSVLRSAIQLVLGLLILVIAAAPAGAHSGTQSYVYLDIYDSSIEGRIEYPVADLNEVLGLSIPSDVDGALEGAEANLATIHAYSAEHFSLTAPAGIHSFLRWHHPLEDRS